MTIQTAPTDQPSRLAMARSRGVVTGLLLMALGAWGAIVPFIGHSFSYGFTPDNTWTWTAARGWLEVLPGAAAFLGGLLLIASAHRGVATLAGWLAAAAGAWFVLGTVIAPLWSAGNIGVPIGSTDHQVLERIGMFSGLGLVIVFLAAIAAGRVSVSSAPVVTTPVDREVDVVQLPSYPATTDQPATSTTTTTVADRARGEAMPSDPASTSAGRLP